MLHNSRKAEVICDTRGFHDKEIWQMSEVDNIAKKGLHRKDQNNFSQKLSPMGIEPKISWSSLWYSMRVHCGTLNSNQSKECEFIVEL